jgi:hypothetical protein
MVGVLCDVLAIWQEKSAAGGRKYCRLEALAVYPPNLGLHS